ncbi:MAG: gamma-glutamylcyclotransferase [Pseudomonadota bacterium]
MAQDIPQTRYFFGYGSLVNRKTHDFEDIRTARLKGWRRIWRHTDLRPVAYLTVVPDPMAEIDGLMAAVPDAGWGALDERERAYDRVSASHQIIHDIPQSPEIVVYSIPDGKHGQPENSCPVLMSYLDVVVQGYLQEFGEEGARAFFSTTHGWDAPIVNDRATPVYSRAQILSSDQRGLVDEMLTTLGVTIIDDVPNQLWRD